METGSPSIARVLTMVLFTLSCIGLMLFLWLSFGGTIPFNPQSYEFKASFPDASQLADQADVRIAGVTVGKVLTKSLAPGGNRTLVTMSIQNKFAPIHKDAQAILREKTILGETSPKDPSIASLNGRLYIAWKGDGNDNLNVMYSADNGATFGHKFTSAETSPQAPALCVQNGSVFMAWKGDGNDNLNVARL